MRPETDLAAYGPRLLEKGYPIVPIKVGTKHPGFAGWQKTEANQAVLSRWIGSGFGGVGILARQFPAVDLDVQDAGLVDQLVAWCEAKIGPTVQRVGHAPKQLLVFRTQDPFAKMASDKYRDADGREHKVEILGDGQQFVAYSIHPETGVPYRWVSGRGLADVAAEDLPLLDEGQARALIAYFEEIRPKAWQRVERAAPRRQPAGAQGNQSALQLPAPGAAPHRPRARIEPDALAEALSFLDPDMRMAGWVRIGMALHHQFDGGPEGFRLWNDWSARGAKYRPAEMRARWRSFAADLSRTVPVTVATILHEAKAKGWAPRRAGPGSKNGGGGHGGQAGQAGQAAPASRPGEAGALPRFGLIHAKDVMARLGPVKWRIDTILEDNTTGLIFGDPGAFKSFLALDMAFHVASGKAWHGHPVKQGPVIYIAGEGHGGLARRFAAWQRHHGVDLAGLPLYVSAQAAQFYNRDSALQVIDAIHAIAAHTAAPALIVIDTLARNFGPGDENSNNDMGLFLSHVDGLVRARFGATVAIVHHTGHSHKDRARGATALKGGMDFEYRVEALGGGLQVRLTCTKMKDAREPEPLVFQGREIAVGCFDGTEVTSLVFESGGTGPSGEPPLRGKQAELLALVAREGPLSREELRARALQARIFATADQLRNALQQLKKKAVLQEEDGVIRRAEDAEWRGGGP